MQGRAPRPSVAASVLASLHEGGRHTVPLMITSTMPLHFRSYASPMYSSKSLSSVWSSEPLLPYGDGLRAPQPSIRRASSYSRRSIHIVQVVSLWELGCPRTYVSYVCTLASQVRDGQHAL
jgi:hypothetical protein